MSAEPRRSRQVAATHLRPRAVAGAQPRAVPVPSPVVPALDVVVADLGALWTKGSLACALAVAALVIGKILGGDPKAGADDRFRRNPSYRALAEHPDLPFSPSYLASTVRVHAQVKALGESLGNELSMSHHEELLPVKDPAVRKALAKEAVAKGYSVTKLRDAVKRDVGPARPAPEPYRPKPLEQFDEGLRAVIDAYPGRPGDLEPARMADLRDSLESHARKILKFARSLDV